MVEEAGERSLVSDRLHLLDATHLAAKVDLFPLKGALPGARTTNSPDPDACFGRKSQGKVFTATRPMRWRVRPSRSSSGSKPPRARRR